MQKREMKNRILYAALGLVMLVPLLKGILLPGGERPLQGAFTEAKKPGLTAENWFSGKYQDSASSWLNESFGYRKTLVRLRNQTGWELFGFAYANSTMLGKEGYLFDIDNMRSYNGKDFIGEDSIRKRVMRIRRLQEVLAGQGITLVVALAPGKASFYHEYLPDAQQEIAGPTNYASYKSLFEENGINLLDFHAWFDTLKTKSPYPLYPKCGVHWSRLGALFAADSLIGYVSSRTGEPMPKFVYKRIYKSDTLRDPDFDIGSAMNLLYPIDPPPMYYADFRAGDPVPGNQPRALVIADSYYWTMPVKEMQQTAFRRIDFSYYNHDFYPGSDPSDRIDMNKINLLSEISGCDVVILLVTDANLPRFPWGFDQSALQALADPAQNKASYRRMHIAWIERGIRADENWLGKVRAYAEQQNLPLDTAVRRNAEWVFDRQQEEKVKSKTKAP